jgi:prephenate dehydratase
VTAVSRCAYLGPRGTFCEQAVIALHPGNGVDLMACASIEATLEAVHSGQADRAVVPIESSVEGGVNATLDELASGPQLLINAEVVVPVEFALLVRPGTELGDIKVIGGHPVAQPQCRQWLASNLPDAHWRPTLSNADAAKQVADSDLDAALAGSFAARLYRLEVLADGIHDNAAAVTRFVEVGQPGELPAATGSDRTSVIAYLTDDHPGALMDILSQFAVRGVNLTRIESRPTGEGIGRYCFFIDCAGHVGAPRVGEALMGLRRTSSGVRFLGSYPMAEGPPAQAGPLRGEGPFGEHAGDAFDDAFSEAAAWLDRIRRGSV